MMNARFLASRYQAAHNEMRNVDGLQPQEAFDELLKYVFFKEHDEAAGRELTLADGFASASELGEAAEEIRRRFGRYIRDGRSVPPRWEDEGFLLSDLALAKVHSVFSGMRLLSTGLDLRSSALREFLSGPVRKGLGIFLTPETVVREIVAAVAIEGGESVLDPACGSATFLIEAAQSVLARDAKAKLKLFGIDKNPRMIQLAQFNGGHLVGVEMRTTTADSLLPFGDPAHPSWLREAAFDVIVTNPPFGVSLDARACSFADYLTCRDASGLTNAKQSSEVVFLERALQLLKPDGRLGIVIPRSVITNQRLAEARRQLGTLGAVVGLITLPPETFAATGTQTTTVVLLVQKYGAKISRHSYLKPVIARVENVGYDLSGRDRAGSQLSNLGLDVAKAIDTEQSSGIALVQEVIKAEDSFGQLEKMLGGSRTRGKPTGRPLSDLVQYANTGATPPRSAYTPSGLFLVKVGNLSGAGINWVARDRNFIVPKGKRFNDPERLLRSGDILLTSSAHMTKYIGKKMDIVTTVPDEVGGQAFYVGEVMLVRPREGIDPFLLLAYLRSPEVVEALQDRVRGQTAHLHPDDLLTIQLNEALYSSSLLRDVAGLLREEAALNDRLNELAFAQARLRAELSDQSALLELAAE